PAPSLVEVDGRETAYRPAKKVMSAHDEEDADGRAGVDPHRLVLQVLVHRADAALPAEVDGPDLGAQPDETAPVDPVLQHGGHPQRSHFLRPIRFCPNSTATRSPASKAASKPALTISPTSFGSDTRSTVMPMSSSAPWVARPIGPCQGLKSAYSPRIVTKVKKGKLALDNSENMLTQLPTPLLCISSTARWPPSHAPLTTPTPSSSV